MALREAIMKELHRNWIYSTSVLSIIQPPLFKLDFVRLASLTLAVLMVDGPLLQRASTVRTVKYTIAISITFPIRLQPIWNLSTQFNLGTAYKTVSPYQPEFGDIVRASNNQEPINIPAGIYTGNCTAAVTIAGFDRSCTMSRTKMSEVQFGAAAKVIVATINRDDRSRARTFVEPHF